MGAPSAAKKKKEKEKEAKMTAEEKAAAKKDHEKAKAALKADVAAAKKKFDDCWKADGIDAACQADAGAYWELVQHWDHEESMEKKLEAALKKHGATIGIIIGCAVGALCIGGVAWWYCKHKGKNADKSENNFDDLYEAFVDSD